MFIGVPRPTSAPSPSAISASCLQYSYNTSTFLLHLHHFFSTALLLLLLSRLRSSRESPAARLVPPPPSLATFTFTCTCSHTALPPLSTTVSHEEGVHILQIENRAIHVLHDQTNPQTPSQTSSCAHARVCCELSCQQTHTHTKTFVTLTWFHD